MNATIQLSREDLTNLVAAVAEYNGYHATGLVITKGDQPIEFDGAQIAVEMNGLQVKIAPENKTTGLANLLREVRQSYTQPSGGPDNEQGA